jgi:membrane-associated phospholipid phosphatase
LVALTYVTFGLWAEDVAATVGALLVFGGLFVTSVVVRASHPERLLGRLVQAGYPLVFWPLLYQQAVDIVLLEPARYVDPVLARLDAFVLPWTTAMLGGPMEELASLFYVSYYVALPLGFFAAWRRDPETASRYSTAILVAFVGCALLWLAVPAGGIHPNGCPTGTAWGPFTSVARFVYATNPHYAAAFPSSHVALSVAAAYALHRAGYGRWALVWAFGIALATVVGQYHYAVDAVAGWAVGWFAARRVWAETD